MVLVYLKSGDCIEVAAAVATEQDDERLFCLARDGYRLATFQSAEVQAFTIDPRMAEQMKEEVCDDLTVLPPDPSQEGKQASV
jgi:hypothetical protein